MLAAVVVSSSGRQPEPQGVRTQRLAPIRSLKGEHHLELVHRVQEEELIERVRAGDIAAARQLDDLHIGAVHRLAIRMTGDEALAQEAA